MKMKVIAGFHPVGQGLFSTGELDVGSEAFRWIYDCGTTSAQRFLNDALDQVHADWGGGRPSVDLVVLSHFDHDHISGLLLVLQHFHVKNLVLPHVPFEQRLIQAFQYGVRPRSRIMRFMLDPVAYLRSLGDLGPDRILLVLAAPRDRAPDEDRPDDLPDPQGRDDDGPDTPLGPLEVDVEDPEHLDEEVREELGPEHPTKPAQAIASGSALRIANLWEFVPYNDASLMPKAPMAFARAVRRQRAVLLARPDKAALDALKQIYDKEFTKSKGGRNIVSLFMYAGSLCAYGYIDWDSYRDDTRYRGWARRGYYGYRGRHRPTAGFLYTGDGYLDTPLRLRQYLRYLGTRRQQGANCLQVMHHGSRTNWHAGVAAALQPVASIFSSNPAHRKFKHPHGEVVRDFLPYQPIQVDTSSSAFFQVGFW